MTCADSSEMAKEPHLKKTTYQESEKHGLTLQPGPAFIPEPKDDWDYDEDSDEEIDDDTEYSCNCFACQKKRQQEQEVDW